jgi:hypothetical protein
MHGVSADPEWRLLAQPTIRGRGLISIGAVRDPTFGTAMLLGAGGEHAEDSAAPRRALLLPCTAADLDGLAGWAARVLDAPVEATRATVSRLAGPLDAHPDVEEIDINPLAILDGRLVALDALIACGQRWDGSGCSGAGAPERASGEGEESDGDPTVPAE